MSQDEVTRKRARYVTGRALWLLRNALFLIRCERAGRRVQSVGDRLVMTSWRRT